MIFLYKERTETPEATLLGGIIVYIRDLERKEIATKSSTITYTVHLVHRNGSYNGC
jgi:hypothetical protein